MSSPASEPVAEQPGSLWGRFKSTRPGLLVVFALAVLLVGRRHPMFARIHSALPLAQRWPRDGVVHAMPICLHLLQ
jgi:hypothetical protein